MWTYWEEEIKRSRNTPTTHQVHIWGPKVRYKPKQKPKICMSKQSWARHGLSAADLLVLGSVSFCTVVRQVVSPPPASTCSFSQ